jgi:hypothetical protein
MSSWASKNNSTFAQYGTLQIQKKLDEEKLRYAGLEQQNGFGRAFSDCLLRLVKDTEPYNNL